MSHRAYVVIQRDTNSFDIHHSANGADDLYLTDLLKRHVADGTRDIDGVADEPAKQIQGLAKWEQLSTIQGDVSIQSGSADEPPINPNPTYTGVPLEKVGLPVDYAHYEAFYLVRDGQVETYVPIWLEPDVIRPWREHLTVEVYRAGRFPDSPRALVAELDATNPLRVIDRETFQGAEWVEDTIVSDVVFQYHEYVYALHHVSTDDDIVKDVEETKRILTTDPYFLQIIGPTKEIIPDPIGRGLLIQIPNNNTSKYANVIELVNAARIDAGIQLNSQATVTEEDRSIAMKDILVKLLQKYHDDVAGFSPKPWGPLAMKVADAIGE